MRMKNAAKNAKFAEPKFDLYDFFRVTFKRNQTDSKELAIEISDKLAIENSDRISIILNYLEENVIGKNADFAKLLGLSPQRIRQILQEMITNANHGLKNKKE